jgi:hypothetical protein
MHGFANTTLQNIQDATADECERENSRVVLELPDVLSCAPDIWQSIFLTSIKYANDQPMEDVVFSHMVAFTTPKQS